MADQHDDETDQLLRAMTHGYTVTDDIVVACLYLDGATSGAAGSALRLRLVSPDDLAPTRRTLRGFLVDLEEGSGEPSFVRGGSQSAGEV